MVLSIAVILVIGFIAVTLLLYLLQDRMVFYPQSTDTAIRDRYTAHEITVRRGSVTLGGWFFGDAVDAQHPLVVYYGGNAEDVSLNLDDLDCFDTRSFLFMNYRGYGTSDGRPTERTLVDDALFILDHLLERHAIDPAHVVLMGRSLGSGVAVQVAAKRPVGGVILVTPFDSLVNVARAHYPLFPVGRLLRHRFDSAALAPAIKTRALFLTAAADQVVPVRFARRLEQLWGGAVTAVEIPGTDHNDIETSPAYWAAVNAFLADTPRP